MLFLDGVGLGATDPAVNPLAAAATPVIERLVGSKLVAAAQPVATADFVFRRLDATLGHDGLPQSATGQTAILTGVNGAEVMNGHYGPWPGPTLKRVLEAGSLFHLARDAGGTALANAYPPGYFEAMKGRRFRPNAFVFAATSAGVTLRGADDYDASRAVASDLDGAHFAALGRGSSRAGPGGSARALSAMARGNAFTVLDVWLTDHYGHRGELATATALVERFDALLGDLVASPTGLVAEGGTLVVTSDHGNLEDLSTGSHTRNEVPMLAVGPAADRFAAASSLLDIAPAAAEVIAAWSET